MNRRPRPSKPWEVEGISRAAWFKRNPGGLGLPRDTSKRDAVLKVLADPAWAGRTNRDVAQEAGVSDVIVGRIRKTQAHTFQMPECPDYDDLVAARAALGRPLESLRVLAPENDPFYAGMPGNRAKAEWFAGLWNAHGFRRGTHLRRIHYVLISQLQPVMKLDGTPYLNTDEDFERLCGAAGSARYLRLVDAADFVDRRNPEAIVAKKTWELPAGLHVGGSFEKTIFGSAPRLFVSEPSIRQPINIEIWIEKSTMNDVLEPIAERYNVTLQSFVGESSTTRCREAVQRAIADGRPTRVLYISDFDPAGDGMPVAAARKMEFEIRDLAPHLDVQLRPIALTFDQCRHFRLPRTPIKETEVRAGRFEDRYGDGATELDALEALHPGALRNLVIKEIERYHDSTLRRRMYEQLSDVQDELAPINEEVNARHAEEVEALRQRYEALDQERNELWNRISAELRTQVRKQGIDIGDIEWPEPKKPDEDGDPLFDSTRDYSTQLDRFKEHQGKETGRRPKGTWRRGRRSPDELSEALQVGDEPESQGEERS